MVGKELSEQETNQSVDKQAGNSRVGLLISHRGSGSMQRSLSYWLVTDWMLWSSAGRSLQSMLKTSRDTTCCVWLQVCVYVCVNSSVFWIEAPPKSFFVSKQQTNQTVLKKKKKNIEWKVFNYVSYHIWGINKHIFNQNIWSLLKTNPFHCLKRWMCRFIFKINSGGQKSAGHLLNLDCSMS